ncbi:MAG TPA: maleylpyruvate isomerase N-terminal domain-containing protein [Thermoanaerobaculia bacterium]|nr:maleylpyruvate isomerase N-terminal domain-containing protein [Thermoanaerobaculia bacterium]
MEPLPPTDTRALFHPLHRELIALLRGLSDDDWMKPTVAGAWRVRDVVAHLLDTDLRRLSSLRDHFGEAPDAPIDAYGDLVAFLNRLNASWVAAMRRLSPRLLVDMQERFGTEAADAVIALPPDEEASFSVAWAGEARSANWFDVGREYTERWHHQMQIRDAVGAPLLLDAEWLVPLLELSLRALPHAYGGSRACVVFDVPQVGVWSLRDAAVYRGAATDAELRVTLDGDTAWRLLYNALPEQEARERVTLHGDASLAEPLFRARSVMV